MPMTYSIKVVLQGYSPTIPQSSTYFINDAQEHNANTKNTQGWHKEYTKKTCIKHKEKILKYYLCIEAWSRIGV